MKKTMVFVIIILIGLTACAKQSVAPASAPETEMKPVIESNAFAVFDKWPLGMDAERALALGLRETTLTKPVRVFNHMGTVHGKVRWQPETLPTGTKVLVGEDGVPLYKRDCFNKLFVPVALQPVTNAPAVAEKGKMGAWELLRIAFLVLLAMALAFLMWNASILQRLARWLYEHSHEHNDPPAPRGGLRSTVPPTAPPVPNTNIWAIRASLDTNKIVHVAGEGIKSVSVEFPPDPNKQVLIKASRR